MRKTILSTAVVAGLALGVALGCTAQADSSTQAPEGAAQGSQKGAAPQNPFEVGQAQIAAATARLEAEFAKQFEQADIQRASLEKMIADVLQSFPESAQPRVKLHIDEVIETGRQLAPKMTPAERSKAVAPTPMEKLGKTQQGLITGWGWGTGLGFGGLGAFGFPGAYYYSSPWYGGLYGTGYGCGYAGAWCGTGLGLGGWYWGV